MNRSSIREPVIGSVLRRPVVAAQSRALAKLSHEIVEAIPCGEPGATQEFNLNGRFLAMNTLRSKLRSILRSELHQFYRSQLRGIRPDEIKNSALSSKSTHNRED